jgi:hypothetical protein
MDITGIEPPFWSELTIKINPMTKCDAKIFLITPHHPLPLKRLCHNERTEPSFPRKRESSIEFVQHSDFLDARFRGHDELRHSLHGDRVRDGQNFEWLS